MEINWLPIGSVVQLAKEGKPLMICGRAQKERDTGEIWDYSACPYPEGSLSPEQTFLFNRGQVERLLFIGYQTEENALFAQQLDGLLKAAKENEGD